MLSPSIRELLKRIVRVQTIIWIAFMASTIVYVVIGNIVATGRTQDPPPIPELLPPALMALSVVLAAASVFYRRHAFSESTVEKKLKEPPQPTVFASGQGQQKAKPDPKLLAAFEALESAEQRLIGLSGHYQTSMIVAWAMNEAIAIFGLIQVIMGAPLWTVMVYCGVSLFLNLVSRPTAVAFAEEHETLARRVGMTR